MTAFNSFLGLSCRLKDPCEESEDEDDDFDDEEEEEVDEDVRDLSEGSLFWIVSDVVSIDICYSFWTSSF